jgi:hypothetical protein
MGSLNVEKLAQELAQGLTEYSDLVTAGIKKAIDEVSVEAVEELKSTSPVRTGDYSKDWTSKKAYEDTRSKRNTVYNKGHYQLTHLLEFGYAKRNGGRVAPQAHIKTVEERVVNNLEEKIKGEIS